MKPKIIALPYFDRVLKRLIKMFRTLPSELAELEKVIENDPHQGKDLGAGLFKIRLASKSKGRGKSGGFRVITYYVEQVGDDEVFIWSPSTTSRKKTISIRQNCLLSSRIH